jgi:hypothetical protein
MLASSSRICRPNRRALMIFGDAARPEGVKRLRLRVCKPLIEMQKMEQSSPGVAVVGWCRGADTCGRCSEVPCLLEILDLLRVRKIARGRHFVGADYNDAFQGRGDH